MTIEQYFQAMLSMLIEIRNNARPAGTQAIFLVDLFPQTGLSEPASPPATSPPGGWPQGTHIPDRNDHPVTMLDAPEHYDSTQASIWAAGYNAGVAAATLPPKPAEHTDAEKCETLRKALCKDLWGKQNELSMVNCEYKNLAQRRAALISQVSALQLKLTKLKQETGDE